MRSDDHAMRWARTPSRPQRTRGRGVNEGGNERMYSDRTIRKAAPPCATTNPDGRKCSGAQHRQTQWAGHRMPVIACGSRHICRTQSTIYAACLAFRMADARNTHTCVWTKSAYPTETALFFSPSPQGVPCRRMCWCPSNHPESKTVAPDRNVGEKPNEAAMFHATAGQDVPTAAPARAPPRHSGPHQRRPRVAPHVSVLGGRRPQQADVNATTSSGPLCQLELWWSQPFPPISWQARHKWRSCQRVTSAARTASFRGQGHP